MRLSVLCPMALLVMAPFVRPLHAQIPSGCSSNRTPACAEVIRVGATTLRQFDVVPPLDRYFAVDLPQASRYRVYVGRTRPAGSPAMSVAVDVTDAGGRSMLAMTLGPDDERKTADITVHGPGRIRIRLRPEHGGTTHHVVAVFLVPGYPDRPPPPPPPPPSPPPPPTPPPPPPPPPPTPPTPQTPQTPQTPEGGFSGVYTANLAASLEAHNETRNRYYGGVGRVSAALFQQQFFKPGVTLTFFADGSGVAQGGPRDVLQRWSGLPGVATFAWRRLPNRNLRVRFVRAATDVMSGQRDVVRLQVTYEERGNLLYPTESFVVKVGTSSYVRMATEQRMQGFSVLGNCPGSWQGQSLHLYRTLSYNDDFANAAYARTSATASPEARGAAARVAQYSYIIPPRQIDSYFEDSTLRCSGNPGVVY